MNGGQRRVGLNVDCEDDLSRRLAIAAFDVIAKCYVPGRHQIGAAILDDTGEIHLGVHIEAMVGRASICAEAVALGLSRLAGNASLIAVASVRYPKPNEGDAARLVPPCGLCREVLLDYAPELVAIIDIDGIACRTLLADLLPHKYVGTKWNNSGSTS
jgi:cytidine deaminase